MGQLWRLGIRHGGGIGHGTWGYTGDKVSWPKSQVNCTNQVCREGAEEGFESLTGMSEWRWSQRSHREPVLDSIRVLLLPAASVLRREEGKTGRNILKLNKFVSFYTIGPKSQNIQFPPL